MFFFYEHKTRISHRRVFSYCIKYIIFYPNKQPSALHAAKIQYPRHHTYIYMIHADDVSESECDVVVV